MGRLPRAITWIVLLLCLLWWPLPTQAATIVVETTAYGVVNNQECSLAEAIIAANSNQAGNGCVAGDDSPLDTIVLGEDMTYRLPIYDVTHLEPTGLPPITSTMLIGGNHAIIERTSSASFRLIHILAGGKLTLDEVSIRNGVAITNGGAIFNEGGLILLNSRIISNTAAAGGGIYNSPNSTLMITNTLVASNSATLDGGGLYAGAQSSIKLYATQFISNSAAGYGGALYATTSQTTITGSKFLLNEAARGGAIASLAQGALTIGKSEIAANVAILGGGVYSELGKLTLDGAQLTRNRAQAGGGLYNSEGDATLSGSDIIANLASNKGGGIVHSAAGSGATMTITDTDIVQNEVSGPEGGGLYYFGGEVTISHTRFVGNRAARMGSALFQGAGSGALTQSCVVGNTHTAIVNKNGAPLDARNNWWGVEDGASGTGPGHGDSVSDGVISEPFLAAPILQCPLRAPVSEMFLPEIRR